MDTPLITLDVIIMLLTYIREMPGSNIAREAD
jgi:hypothetical protein